jgi:microsomal dipeptidase-like Zn-dependent dipeptidase
VIADLHCHYPMHLLPRDRHPHRTAGGWFRRLEDEFDADAVDLLARVLNNPGWDEGWRVDLDGLVAGGARLVCSVLYWPEDEFQLDTSPAPGSFADLKGLLAFVEGDLQKVDPPGAHHVIVKRPEDLDDQQRVAFVHCIEGGFHLGPDEEAIEANVAWLAEHGVLYITLAHLFFRGVATNAPAIPPLSDAEYDDLFPQTAGLGLTGLGKAAVRSMYRHKVLIDISHMRQQAIDDTFALLEELDRESGSDPREYPVLATHVGMREATPDAQTYNLSRDTAQRVQTRGGLIGMIMAQHQLGSTDDPAASRDALRRHLQVIAALGDGLASCAIGSDLDGFIKPTLSGLERASDLVKLERWVREDFPDDADAILYDNARRVVGQVFAGRA